MQTSLQCDAPEVSEGTTYETAIAATDVEPNVEVVPPRLATSNAKPTLFDIETTGLSRTCDIVQLSALCGTKTFDKNMSSPVRAFTQRLQDNRHNRSQWTSVTQWETSSGYQCV